MSDNVILVENLSKSYHLGIINTGTFTNDLKVWLAKKYGRENPQAKIGEKDFGNRDGEVIWALRDVNFCVKSGETLGIIGSNGAGKSTLLKILSRVTTPTKGRVRAKGRIASLLEVGTGFHPELTGRENIYLNGAIMGMSQVEVKQKLDEIIDFSGVDKYIDTPVKRYSSGMYVRLAFAVAAHLEPEILVVDEVLAVGDAEFQKKCLGKMGEVAGEGRTVLFVSHNMGAISTLCNRAILIDKGKILLDGSADSVISSYISKDDIVSNPFNNCTRRGNGEVHITSISFETKQGENRTAFQSGEPIVVVLGFINNKKDASNRYSFGFSIQSQDQIGLLNNYSHFSKTYYKKLPDKGFIKCIIEKNPLVAKQYYVSCRVVMNGDQYNGQEVDWPNISIPLKIINGDFYKTGSHFSSDWGYFLVEGNWLPVQGNFNN